MTTKNIRRWIKRTYPNYRKAICVDNSGIEHNIKRIIYNSRGLIMSATLSDIWNCDKDWICGDQIKLVAYVKTK